MQSWQGVAENCQLFLAGCKPLVVTMSTNAVMQLKIIVMTEF